MTIQTVTDAIRYVGVDDNTVALFEKPVPRPAYGSELQLLCHSGWEDRRDGQPRGRTGVGRMAFQCSAGVGGGRSPDYLVVTHMERIMSGSPHRNWHKSTPEMKIIKETRKHLP